MKRINLILAIFWLFTGTAIGQSISGTVTKVPCNNDGVYDVTTTGLSTPITYTYYVNGGPPTTHSNVNSTSDQLSGFGFGLWGWISVQATDGINTVWTNNSYTTPFSIQINVTNPTCPDTMGTISATRTGGSTGPFSYEWKNNITSATYTTSPATVPLGEYGLKMTDNTTGCVLEIVDTAAYVSQISNVTATITTTNAACTNGTATAVPSGGTAPYSIRWANGATTSTITGLTQGNYGVVITDSKGCKSNPWLRAYVRQTPWISVNTVATDATCLQPDGKVQAFGSGGVPPYSYAWSDGQSGQTATNLSGNTSITVIATDANGCTGQRYTYVKSSTPINVTYSSTASSCTTDNGSATLSMTGGTAPYSVVWYTYPNHKTGNTLSNVGPGSYSFKVTDAVGCIRTGTAVVPPESTINAYISTTNAVCPGNNGTARANVWGTDPPFTYDWNTSATSAKITGLAPGSYSCTVSDAKGCSVTKREVVKRQSPVSVSVTSTPVSCIFNKDGTATSIVSGGTPPYTYSYTGGATTANANNLGEGRNYLTVTDANGCSTTRMFYVHNAKTTDNCYCTIEGNVYLDVNADCNYDANEIGIQNIMVHCSGFGYKFTDANGYYSFQVPTGTYTIKEQVNHYYPLQSCQPTTETVSVTAASGCTKTVNIANDTNTIHDLKITTVNANLPPVPGYSYMQKVIVKNEGTVTESSVQLGYEHDGQLPYTSSTLSSFNQPNATTHPDYFTVTSGHPTLAPAQSSSFNITYATPASIPLNTVLVFKDTAAHAAPVATSWLLDYSPWNNVNQYEPVVVGSYDPNYKEVSPAGEGEEGFISDSVTEFDYTIHFQNEGTYFARNIFITDQLDEDLDWSTMKPGYSDYDYTVEVSETGMITFTFENINLPWKSSYGDALSSGLVNFSISRKESANKPGTKFENTAYIYFDFNEAIITNTTVNTIRDTTTSIEEYGDADLIIGEEVTLDLYPVPANDEINIRLNNVQENETAMLRIVNIMGRVVLSENLSLQQGTNVLQQNVSNLPTGSYFALVQMQDGTVLTKKMVLHTR